MSDQLHEEFSGASEFGPDRRYRSRSRAGAAWKAVFAAATVFAVLALSVLLLSIIDDAFGLVAVRYETDPASLSEDGRPLEELSRDELESILKAGITTGLARRLEAGRPLSSRSSPELRALVLEHVASPYVERSWPLSESLFGRNRIERELREEFPDAELRFRSWIGGGFLTRPQSSVPEKAGVRTALLGSLWMVAITVLTAFPLGTAAAIYLEEYARDTRLTRFIQVNIYNLAGVPSIIYGLLGLAVFVRAIGPFTSGAAFGAGDPASANGRTILSAGLTLALLVLPTIVIAAQEALRAVPASLRLSSYGLGATKWQTIRHHVLPAAASRILTGVILAVSRAVGETAPLVVVGASTFVVTDPASVFSKFTTLPVQIYQWTARPQAEFRNAAAAAIIVLLALLLSMNAAAILLRNAYGRERRL